ncbi:MULTISPECIES: ROK family transcriptional regulator [unclassified Actinomyces]|uniref:ROK family transcriptional regulator n=1 Tax=unclassified Actinomyces TaxID=2609248 RepID=UPI000D58E94F|nr:MULTISPECIES: ROK family transcriptional regulator [unclassified Actinomyces]RAX22400.1 ROK family transcriptional regulator [Actinomyces sp. Z3]
MADSSAPAGPTSLWTALSDTQREIVLALLRYGRLLRPEIMRIVDISPGSVTRLTTPLVEAGLLTTHTLQVADTGRPQSPLEVRADAESVVGVGLSTNLLTAVLTDLRLGVLATVRRPLTGHSPAEIVTELAAALTDLAGGAADAPPPSCLGISLGGTARDGRTVDEAVFYGWHRVPLADFVEARLGVPTIIGNDLTALTLREAWFGVGREHGRFSLLTVGAGVGHGLVVDGQVVTNADAEMGLLGTVPVPDGARPASAAAAMDCLTNEAIERTWVQRGHDWLAAADVVELATAGDGEAVSLCASYARRLGRLLGMAAAFTLPEVVVVAGERAAIATLFEDEVQQGIAAVRRASATPLDVVVREHDRAEWATGAAALALRARVLGQL